MDFLKRSWAEIDINALKHNFNLFKKHAKDSKIMAVVKADAYGHSAKEIAPVLEQNGADYFAVSNLEEAIDLRNYGIAKPILILGYTPITSAKSLNDYDISQCVYSLEYAKKLSEFAINENIKIKIHIKLDTGMSRIGFDCRSDSLCGINEAIESAKLNNFILEGVFTHFAAADRNDNTEDGFTNEQFERFQKAILVLEQNGINPPLKSCCNSAGFLKDCDKHLSYSRIGISLYGLTPDTNFDVGLPLIPVMTLKSVVSYIKEIQEGDTVSYGRTFKAEKPMKIATVSIGYADGYPRALSNKAYVLINGQKAAIVGRVCMDQICVDVTDINAQMGDEVILFGKDLSVDILADMIGTINYEIVCGISKRVPRIITNG